MPDRQTLPAIWLMSDRALGDALWQAIDRVPSWGGVVLRHHRSDRAFARHVAAACSERGLMLAVAGDVGLAREIKAQMVHNPQGDADGLLVSRSVHNAREAEAAAGADLIFVSPVFATQSHPGAKALGMEQALLLARMSGVPAIALGGIDKKRGNDAIDAGFHGWAAIRAWSE
ncbi:MAG: thiamine phosphate synthase [Pseudomonadota bacterium]|nr:thiamine phosphate synthase [Pseudomonadota bacterium]